MDDNTVSNNTLNLNICQNLESDCFEDSNCCLFPWLRSENKKICVCEHIEKDYYDYLLNRENDLNK